MEAGERKRQRGGDDGSDEEGRVVVMMMMYVIGTFERNEWINYKDLYINLVIKLTVLSSF